MSPLKCTPFERFMLLDDRSSHPMTFLLEVTLQGPIDRDLMDASFREAVTRHPLLQSRVEGDVLRDPHWVPVDTSPQFEILEPDAVPCDNRIFCLTSGPGLHAQLVPDADGGRLHLYFHHAVTDGQGAMTFVMEWMAIYGRRRNRGVVPGTLSEPCMQTLHERGSVPHITESASVTEKLKRFAHRIDIARAVTQPIAAPDENIAINDCDGHSDVRLDANDLSELAAAARRSGNSLNDWMLAALFECIREWNVNRGEFDLDSWKRVLVPVSLRDVDEPHCVANRVSYKFLSRQNRTDFDWPDLLSSISAEMDPVRQRKTAAYLKWIRFAFRIPPLARRMACPKKCMATAVLSNLGVLTNRITNLLPVIDDQFHAGDLVISGIAVAPPKRPLTRVSIATCTYGGELRILARNDGRSLSGKPLREFLEQYQSTLLARIETRANPARAALVAH